jgi:hypothetical protein
MWKIGLAMKRDVQTPALRPNRSDSKFASRDCELEGECTSSGSNTQMSKPNQEKLGTFIITESKLMLDRNMMITVP